jgi:hypothetical protein
MRKYLSRFTLICAAFILTSTAFGQNNIFIGAKGGISIPNLTAGSNNQNPLSNGFSSRLGADFGIFAEFPINKWFSIQPEIDYSAQGGKHNGLQAVPDPYSSTPPYFYANFKNDARLNYLLIPVTAKFNFSLSPKFKLYINAGFFAGFLLSAKTVSTGSSYLYEDPAGQQPVSPGTESFDTTQNIKSSVNSFNVGVIGAVGISYETGPGKIFIEGGGNYGFINIQKYAADGTNYAGAATIHIGYEYALICKKKH